MGSETEPKKEGRGRPTKYDPAFCEVVEREMATGLSLAAVAGVLGVARSTINQWIADHPDFSEAVQRSKATRLLHWERAALRVATTGGGPGTSTMIIFGLKNMGGDEWTDTTKTELSGPNGAPIQAEVTSARELLSGKLARLAGAGGSAGSSRKPE